MLTAPSFLSCELVRWCGSQGDARLSVVCQVSYRLEPGQVRRLDEASASGDMQAPFKSATDVVVVGRGRSDGGPGRLEVGEIDKRLVFVDGQLADTGPLGPQSPERRRWLGRHALQWREGSLAERGFPDDADWRYWNVAPADQQLARPLGVAERIVLEAPGRERVTTRLPGERAVGFAAPHAEATAAEAEPIEMRADTLWLDVDRGICTVSWRGQVPSTDEQVVYVALVRGPTDFESVRELAQEQGSLVDELTTDHIRAVDPEEALPFLRGASERPTTIVEPSDRVETGTLGPEQVRAVMENLSASQDGSTPWIAAAPSTAPGGGDPNGGPRRSSWAPPPADRGSVPPPPLPPAIGAPPPQRPAEAPAPPAVLSPAMFAAASAAAQRPSPITGPEPPAAPAKSSPAKARATANPSEHTQLLWHDPASLERVRAYFEELIDELDFVEPDPKRDLPSDDPAVTKDYHHCLGVLSRGHAGGAHSLYEAYAEAAQRGAFVAPIALVEGELRPSFDEVAVFERRVALLRPIALGDPKLLGELDEAQKLLDSPLGLRVPGTAERIGRELDALFLPKHRAAVDGLDGKVERLLLEDRSFARRPVFGAPHVRATLTCRDDDTPVVVYLREEVADKLPLFASFRCRLLVEVHPRQDGLESHPLALLVVALGRLVRPELPRFGSAARRG